MKKRPKSWYKDITIRPVIDVGGYAQYEKVCGHVADVFFSITEETLRQKLATDIKDSRYITFFTLYKVGEAKCPAYWVSQDLLTALLQSELTVEAESLNWAMKTGIFLLPFDVISSPESRSVYAVFWHYDTTDKFLYWTATDGDSFFCRKFKVSERLNKLTYTYVQDIAPQLVTEFNEYLQAVFLRLILIMECRTDLVETEAEVVRINQGFAKAQARDFSRPLWLGRNYRIKRDTAEKIGTHATPRIHWRRGYLRNQPYGAGRKQRKLVWIEPVLVMSKQQ